MKFNVTLFTVSPNVVYNFVYIYLQLYTAVMHLAGDVTRPS